MVPPFALSNACSSAVRFRPSTRAFAAAFVAAAAASRVHHLPRGVSARYIILLGHSEAHRTKKIVNPCGVCVCREGRCGINPSRLHTGALGARDKEPAVREHRESGDGCSMRPCALTSIRSCVRRACKYVSVTYSGAGLKELQFHLS